MLLPLLHLDIWVHKMFVLKWRTLSTWALLGGSWDVVTTYTWASDPSHNLGNLYRVEKSATWVASSYEVVSFRYPFKEGMQAHTTS